VEKVNQFKSCAWWDRFTFSTRHEISHFPQASKRGNLLQLHLQTGYRLNNKLRTQHVSGVTHQFGGTRTTNVNLFQSNPAVQERRDKSTQISQESDNARNQHSYIIRTIEPNNPAHKPAQALFLCTSQTYDNLIYFPVEHNQCY
jgi:hypothetical protein